jgi:hypothetical protein
VLIIEDLPNYSRVDKNSSVLKHPPVRFVCDNNAAQFRSSFMSKIQSFLRDESGATAIEYGRYCCTDLLL